MLWKGQGVLEIRELFLIYTLNLYSQFRFDRAMYVLSFPRQLAVSNRTSTFSCLWSEYKEFLLTGPEIMRLAIVRATMRPHA